MRISRFVKLLTESGLVSLLLLIQGAPLMAQETTADELEAMLEKELEEMDSPAQQLETKYPKVQEAANEFLQRNFEEAETLMKEAKAANPELPPAGVLMGSLYARTNNSLAARASYEMAVRDEPEDPEPYVVFGENALRQRRFTDAALLFDQAIAVSASYDANQERKKNLSTRAYSGAAIVAQARERWDDAERLLRETIKLKGDDIQLTQRLGQVLFKKAQELTDKEARKKGENVAYREFNRAYQMDSKLVARPEINMARLYQAAGNIKNAKKLVELARERDKEGLGTQLAAAQWAIDTGNKPLLAECATSALRIDDSSLQALVLDGFLKRIEGDFEGAEQSFRAAHQIAPTNPAVLNQLAIALAEQPDERKKKLAFQFAELSARTYSDLKRAEAREAAVTLGWVLYRLGRNVDAARSVQSAVQAGRIGAEAAYMAAKIASDRGNKEAAYQLLKRALEDNERLFPNRDEATTLLARLESDR